jgi:tRNA A58 N-methylase Trm61
MSLLSFGFYLIIIAGSALMLLWLSRGPFFVPTRRKHLSVITAMLDIKAGEKAVDLGSGDGRLLIALANAGAEAHGYEHNPLLVMRSRRNAKRGGVSGRTFVHSENFWNADLSGFSVVTIYGIPYIMRRLEKKLQQELRPGARVLSYSFPFPSWQPAQTNKRIYVYRK